MRIKNISIVLLLITITLMFQVYAPSKCWWNTSPLLTKTAIFSKVVNSIAVCLKKIKLNFNDAEYSPTTQIFIDNEILYIAKINFARFQKNVQQ